MGFTYQSIIFHLYRDVTRYIGEMAKSLAFAVPKVRISRFIQFAPEQIELHANKSITMKVH